MKDYNVMIDSCNLLYEPLKNDIKTYDIRKIAAGQGDDYIIGCLLIYTSKKTTS